MITIFETKLGDKEIKNILLKSDNTFAPMGSGGYEIRENKSKDGYSVFVFRECDTAPARNFVVAVKDGKIFVGKIDYEIKRILTSCNVKYKLSDQEKPPFSV
jgi:hypothetical protein